jgi:type II secretory pathway pseudopilin PulG
MGHSIKSKTFPIAKAANRSRGYILITLMLFMTLIAMAALAVLPNIVQQIQRDREEEMVHRGTEYMRAIKKYYKKFGRYPARVEELENTNQQRFLRKRYKDPIAKGDKEFKLIRQGDPALNMLGLGGGIGQPGLGPGLNPPGAPGNSPFVAQPGGGVRRAGAGDANAPQVTGLPGQENSGTPDAKGSDSDSPDTQVDPKSAASSSDSGPAPGGQVFGGGPILGVASSSKDKTIREFNKKNHYNEWLFIYDPSADRGGLLKGPVQPDANSKGLGGMNPTGAPPAAPGQPGATPQPAGPPGQQQPPEE